MASALSLTVEAYQRLRMDIIEGRFRLDFALPKRTFTAGESIEGIATLSVLGPGVGKLGASGGGPASAFAAARGAGGRGTAEGSGCFSTGGAAAGWSR